MTGQSGTRPAPRLRARALDLEVLVVVVGEHERVVLHAGDRLLTVHLPSAGPMAYDGVERLLLACERQSQLTIVGQILYNIGDGSRHLLDALHFRQVHLIDAHQYIAYIVQEYILRRFAPL